ncbi:hypothetical protein [[Clostridium] scindens]|uniref:hypothetical protein n=1 Tax=Clostridium scindens (strain JCM 10418 / VPI 12708) TaxID=29347 RepID=UPI001D07F0EC|nr:hypothetical protein [[Clostridium] scindens]MCB6420658.1 hypothetical protein [[Clostridium] scindens]
MSNSGSTLDITLHDYNILGNCLADVVLPLTGTVVKDFTVMRTSTGVVHVYMPSCMKTNWTYEEIEWSEVRKQIAIKFKSNLPDKSYLVQLYDFEGDDACKATITLPESGVQVNELKVKKGLGNGVIVHMPSWMHTRWSYPEIQWSDVRKLVIEQYQREVNKRNNEIKEVKKERIFEFYSVHKQKEILVNIVLPLSGTVVEEIRLIKDDLDRMWIFMPNWMKREWKYPEVAWDDIFASIKEEYAYRFDAGHEHSKYAIEFQEEKDVLFCLADIKLPEKKNILKGFRIKEEISGIRISTPKWMKRWNDSIYSWDTLCEMIKKAFIEWKSEREGTPDKSEEFDRLDEDRKEAESLEIEEQSELSNNDTSSLDDLEADEDESDALTSLFGEEEAEYGEEKREKNEYGRIMNAENSALRFFPHTVLRIDNNKEKKRMYELVNAMSKGSIGGIGPFEINILEWVSRLRYVSSTMLLDLLKGGYVSTGWRKSISQAKLAKVISRMNLFDLVSICKFVSVDENGLAKEDGSMRSIMRILTLGKAGNTMLHELGRNGSKYNAFDTYQDGNTVKKYLSANQWLIYWLTTYPAAIDGNYETTEVIYQKGANFDGARFYATVTCNDCTMVAEPQRRVDDFEEENDQYWIKHKYNRFINLFSNLDELYLGQEEISFSQRPILVYICEDDEHMQEVFQVLSENISSHPEQEVWFTTDLRIFNYNMAGKRFLTPIDGNLELVDLQKTIGVSDPLTEVI